MASKQVFFSFHYAVDCVRAAQVRNIGVVDGNEPVSDNDWETVKKGGDAAIEKWIADQLRGRVCTVVLVGRDTAGRRWITHEIVDSWNKGLGVVGICIHGLRDFDGMTSIPGKNPFDYVTLNSTGQSLSTVVKCYNPAGPDSKDRYAWIARYLDAAVDEAVKIRKQHS